MRRSSVRVALHALCVLQIIAVPTMAKAQPPADSGARCFDGRPMPRCRTFWITEVGYYQRALGTTFVQEFETASFERADLDNHYSWEIGFMSNRTARKAVGGTLHVGVDGSGMRVGLKGRQRRWIAGSGVVDLSAGVLRAAIRAPYPTSGAPAYGITGDVALGWRDWAALTVRADVLRGDGRTASALYGGVRLGSYPAIVATVAGAALIGVIVASYGAGT